MPAKKERRASSEASVRVIGIDCAAQPANVGLAFGTWVGGEGQIHETATARTWDEIADRVAAACEGRTLLAVDAPLGWPQPLGDRLHAHRAGDPIPDEANALFRRATDDFVHRTLGKRPLDVGADRIARAAVGALGLLDAVRGRIAAPLEMAWDPGAVRGVEAIEVYPAATLRSRRVVDAGYKGKEAVALARRETLVGVLADEAALAASVCDASLASDHVLDATVSVLAGFDFLRGACLGPADSDRERAAREGWIWIRPFPEEEVVSD